MRANRNNANTTVGVGFYLDVCSSMSQIGIKLALVCVSLLVSQSAFAQAKGHAREQGSNSIQIDISLVVNKAFSGDISAEIKQSTRAKQKQTQVDVPVRRLRELVSKFANEAQISSWFGNDAENIEENQKMSLQDLRVRGLDIEFDESLLTINASVPRLGTQEISLRGNRTPVPEEFFAPSKVSSGLNVIAGSTLNHQGTENNPSGFGNNIVSLSGFTSIGGFGGWSLFYQGDYIEDETTPFARQDITLIHDSFKHGIRYALGDVRPTVSNFQVSPDILGLSVERNYQEINPFRNLTPSGRSTFTLDRPSTVSFEINGEIVNTERLEPGSYSINDFPLAVGANNVRVLVDDGTSNIEVANFSSFVDIELLNPGLTNFGVSLGLPRRTGTGRSIRYESEPALFAFYEKGVSQSLTLGAQLEAKENHALISSKAVYGGRKGLVLFETAVSHRDEIGTGYSSILAYELQQELANGFQIETELQAQYQSDKFITITQTDASDESWALNARTSFRSSELSLTFDAGLSENNSEITRNWGASLNKSFNDFTLALNYAYSKTADEQSDNFVGISLSKTVGRSSARGGFRSNDNEYFADWFGAPVNGAGGIQTNLRAIQNDFITSGEIDLSYINPRFELDVSHVTVDANQPGVNGDGSIAFGRPFSRGFLIVSPHQTIRGRKVSVNRTAVDGELVSYAKRLSTLVPLNNSYRQQRFFFDVEDLPLGYDLGSGDLNLFPSFLSGYKFTLGSDAANTVLGNLVWPDDTPLSLTSGKLIHVETGEELVIFTNRTGRFVAEKARFGDYIATFQKDGVSYEVQIEIPESDEPGLVQTGKLVLELKQ